MEVQIVSADPTWPEQFGDIANDLRKLLREKATRIDHVGSTAVPGLAAKDVIDVQVTVTELDPWKAIPAALASGGYRESAAVLEDHVPPGTSGVSADWQKHFFREPTGRRRAHIHVRELGRPNQRYPLLFRDFLRANADAAAAYEEAKRHLAERFADDRDAYATTKDPICDLIMVDAEDWAALMGWEPGASDA